MIPIITGFDLSASQPIDSRLVVADQTARLAISWVYKGLIVYQVDNTNIYKYTGTPPSNIAGDWALTLSTGAAGTPGSVWYNGSGVPSSGLGLTGDYYLNDLNGDAYQKTGPTTWGLIANLKGPAGASGTASGDYASISTVGGAAIQSISSTPTKITQFNTNGPALGSVPDYLTNKITVTSAGDYTLYFTGDLVGISTIKYQLTIYVNGSPTVVLGTFDC